MAPQAFEIAQNRLGNAPCPSRSMGGGIDIRRIPNLLWRRTAFTGAPVFQQTSAAQRIARFERLARDYAVGAKVAETLPEFAPGHDDARLVEISDAERPDRAFSAPAKRVMIGKRELALRG
jgi:hypothetical protein